MTNRTRAALAALFLGLVIPALLLTFRPTPAPAQAVTTPPTVALACAFNTSPPTIATNNFLLVQCDTNGKLITSSSGGGGGGAVTIADGADVAQGAIADAAYAGSGTSTVIAGLKGIYAAAIGAIPAQSGHGVLIGAVEGTTASGVAVTDNPLLNGARAQSAEATAVAAAQKVASAADLYGKTITSPYANRELYLSGFTTGTDTAAHDLIAAQGGTLKIYVTGIQCSRSDAGTTAIVVTMLDSTPTNLAQMVLPNSGGGGGNNMIFTTPIATAANKKLQFSSGTSTSTVYCTAEGYAGN
jgi:hypothetical protein